MNVVGAGVHFPHSVSDLTLPSAPDTSRAWPPIKSTREFIARWYLIGNGNQDLVQSGFVLIPPL